MTPPGRVRPRSDNDSVPLSAGHSMTAHSQQLVHYARCIMARCFSMILLPGTCIAARRRQNFRRALGWGRLGRVQARSSATFFFSHLLSTSLSFLVSGFFLHRHSLSLVARTDRRDYAFRCESQRSAIRKAGLRKKLVLQEEEVKRRSRGTRWSSRIKRERERER